MSKRYFNHAAEAVAGYLETNLPASLRTIETETGRAAGSLTDPVAYIRGDVSNDNRVPLIQVYSEDFEMLDQHEAITNFNTQIFATVAGDADPVAGRQMAADYGAAIVQCIRADYELDGEANRVVINGGALSPNLGDVSASRFAILIDLTVGLYEGPL